MVPPAPVSSLGTAWSPRMELGEPTTTLSEKTPLRVAMNVIGRKVSPAAAKSSWKSVRSSEPFHTRNPAGQATSCSRPWLPSAVSRASINSQVCHRMKWSGSLSQPIDFSSSKILW